MAVARRLEMKEFVVVALVKVAFCAIKLNVFVLVAVKLFMLAVLLFDVFAFEVLALVVEA